MIWKKETGSMFIKFACDTKVGFKYCWRYKTTVGLKETSLSKPNKINKQTEKKPKKQQQQQKKPTKQTQTPKKTQKEEIQLSKT